MEDDTQFNSSSKVSNGSKDKIFLLITGVIIIGIVGLGLFLFFFGNPGCIGGCRVKEVSQDDLLNYDSASEKNDMSYCEKIKNNYTRDSCFNNFAQNKK